jgi:hypothetical protein
MKRPVIKRAMALEDGDRLSITGTGVFTVHGVTLSTESQTTGFSIVLNDQLRLIRLPNYEHVLVIEENDD